MGFLTALGVGSAIGSTLGSVFNTINSSKYARENLRLQKQSQAESMFMNRNQFQVQSADAIKAGINPLAMQGGSVQSASASNVEGPQMDTAALSNILGLAIQGKIQKDAQIRAQEFNASEAKKNREHEELLAGMKIDAENKRASERLAQEDRQFNANLKEIEDYHSKMIEVENKNISVKEKQNMLQELRDNVAKSAQDVLNDLRIQQKELNEVDLMTRARELANLITTGEKTHNASSLTSLAKNLGLSISGNIKKADEWQQAILNYVKGINK